MNSPAVSTLDPAATGPGPRRAVVAGVLAGALLFTGLNLSLGDFAADELGLGLNTSSVRGERDADGQRLSGFVGEVYGAREQVQELQAAGESVVLWLGASQLHAINERGPDDRLAVVHANRRARSRGAALRYLQISAPNANLQELLRLYRAFRAEPRRLPDVLLLALTYDDLGEPGIRDNVRLLIESLEPSPPRSTGESAGAPPSTPAGADPEAAAPPARPAARAEGGAPIQRSATAGTPQERLEEGLVGLLERVWPGYADRGATRSRLIVGWQQPLTRFMFGIRGRPQQVPDPATAAWNGEALDELIRLTRADGVALWIYKPPHRPGEAPFYHPREAYDAYFAGIEARCEREGIRYLDLETLVPAEVWGLTNNYLPDVFHFQGEGHRLLGEAIDRWFEERGR